jgi:hypothetical protein
VDQVVVGDEAMTPVDLEVGSPQLDIDRTSINLVAHNRVQTSSPLVLHNGGSGILNFSILCEPYMPHGSWLSAAPSAGNIPPGDSLTVDIRVLTDTTDTQVFDFYGYISVCSNACPDSVSRLPVFATILDADERAATVREFALLNAYPNPFNPETRIAFAVPKTSRVRLTVYDLLGREVAMLQDNLVEAGIHAVNFDGSRLSTGMYIVRMDAEGFTGTQKIVLLK